jgi:predicted  nucleic acid-binding Zn-ribbon protein
MLQLELLWQLQNIDCEIARLKKNKKSREMYNCILNIKENYKSLKAKLDNKTTEFDVSNRAAGRLELDLKYMDQKLRENTERLYREGENLKVIDTLQKEIESGRAKIDETEDALLKIVDRSETLSGDIKKDREELLRLKDQYETLRKEYDANSDACRGQLELLSAKRESIIKEVDEDILKRYNDLALKSLKAVSHVSSGTCQECGVRLNAVLYDTLKHGNQICTCEHCGRILYME